MTLAAEHPSVVKKERIVVRGACPHDCPDTCAMLYHVEDGRLVDVKGDPDHPMTNGGLCVKLRNFPEHHYRPDRLLHPMRRVGPKGAGEFEPITLGRGAGRDQGSLDGDHRRPRPAGDHAARLPRPPGRAQRAHGG